MVKKRLLSCFVNLICVVFLISCLACAPTRYETFQPKGASTPWEITADKAAGGIVTVNIDKVKAIEGRVPAVGSREFTSNYKGHKIKMALSREQFTQASEQGIRCVLMVDGTLAARFNW